MTPQKNYNEAHTNKLEGKVTLIIGGDSERAGNLAVRLAEQGSDIALLYFNEPHAIVEQIHRNVEAAGGRCLTIAGSANNHDAMRDAVRQIIATFGRLDIFISYPYQLAEGSTR